MFSGKYLITAPYRDTVERTLAKIADSYDEEFVLILGDDYPYDLDTIPGLDDSFLQALRNKGIEIKEYY